MHFSYTHLVLIHFKIDPPFLKTPFFLLLEFHDFGYCNYVQGELNDTTPESTNSADRFTAAQANSYRFTLETAISKM